MTKLISDEQMVDAQQFVAALQSVRSILVAAHANPDGDAIGSTTAVAEVCRQIGLNVTVYNQDPVPEFLKFLPGTQLFKSEIDPNMTFDAVLIVDCGNADRVGQSFVRSARYGKAFVLDHHIPDTQFGDVIYNDTTAASACEMVYRIAKAAGTTIHDRLATAIFVGMSTDTGGFRFGNTNAVSLGIAAEMSAAGANAAEIARNLYERQTLPRIRMMAEVLSSIDVCHQGKTASIVITQDLLARNNATMQMVEGYIDYARAIDGVRVAVQYREIGDGSYKISLRSHGSVNVQSVATQFEGGGHFNAAGCRIFGDLPTARSKIEAALIQLYQRIEMQ